MKNHYQNRFNTYFAVALILLSAGCASAPDVKQQASVFYPEPPELARLQFLKSFTGSKDIVPERSSFSKFVTGAQEVVVKLDKPYGVAIRDGKIYVCDSNQTVMVIDLEKKTFLPLQGAQGRGKLIQPLNISIDKDGNKYVSDPIRQQVVMFDKNDLYVKSFGPVEGWKPIDAVVYEDKLYVADIKNRDVKVLSLENGEIVQRLGSSGEPKDRLGLPTNLAFDKDGFLYVSDAGRFQIVKLDRDGNLRSTIGSHGSQLASFARPRGITIDKENRVYAVDAAFDNVQMFTKDGQLLFYFGKPGNNPGDLFLPAQVAVDYNNISYFQSYVDPKFEIEALVIVTSQFGDRLVNVYGLGKEKGKTYPTEEELKKRAIETKKNLLEKEKKQESGEQKEEKEEKK
jgi:DNA-binding beta-propeller fold protein YncE